MNQTHSQRNTIISFPIFILTSSITRLSHLNSSDYCLSKFPTNTLKANWNGKDNPYIKKTSIIDMICLSKNLDFKPKPLIRFGISMVCTKMQVLNKPSRFVHIYDLANSRRLDSDDPL